MPTVGHQRSYSFSQKSIYLGRCVKHRFIRRFSSLTSSKKLDLLLLSPSLPTTSLDRNTSALPEQPIFRSGLMLPTFNTRHEDFSSIPPAPPLPSTFSQQLSSETIKSTDFSKAIKSHLSSITPSGTDLSQSMLIRPSQIIEPPPIISMTKSTIYSNPIGKNNHLRNRRRTPLTPDVLALTKLRRPEHIKSSIAQRIEELKHASSIHTSVPDDKPIRETQTDLLVTCEYKNIENERTWLKEQTQLKSPIRFSNTNNSLHLNNRLFHIRSIEFLDQHNVRFYAREQPSEENFFTKYFKQISILTILIISILRLIENILSNLSIPGVQIILNFIYIFILITIVVLLLGNQKQ